jgi:HEAT repeat protein
LSVRAGILKILGGAGSNAAPAVPVIAQCTRDTRDLLHHFAIQALGRIGSSSASALPDLITCLDNTDPVARRSAAFSLGQISSRRKAIKKLERATNDTNQWVAAFACLAVWKLITALRIL